MFKNIPKCHSVMYSVDLKLVTLGKHFPNSTSKCIICEDEHVFKCKEIYQWA